MNNRVQQEVDVVVVGGGLSGLAAATYLARTGRSVIVFERSGQVGGRAITNDLNGFLFNLGPHAIYRKGVGARVLRELGVGFSGGSPSAAGYALHQGQLRTLPTDPWSLFTTNLFGFPAKLEMARLLTSIGKIDPQAIRHLTLQEWLEREVRRPEVRQLFSAIVRLSTYANEPERLSADVAIGQLQLGLKGVYYLDHGWQVLVDGLRVAAEEAGAKIVTSAKVVAVERDGVVRGVRLEDGSTWSTSVVIVATTPAVAAALIEGSDEVGFREWADAVIPVRAATLDIGLSRLPQPHARFVLGIDRPVYLSVHSGVAKLAPEGGAMIHVAKYLPSDDETDPKAVGRELEELLDLVQPGWRDVLVERRFLSNIVVVNALATAAQGGLSGRPGPEVPGIPNLYVAGDWVGQEGWLSDGSLASAKRAADLILRKASAEPFVQKFVAAATSAAP